MYQPAQSDKKISNWAPLMRVAITQVRYTNPIINSYIIPTFQLELGSVVILKIQQQSIGCKVHLSEQLCLLILIISKLNKAKIFHFVENQINENCCQTNTMYVFQIKFNHFSCYRLAISVMNTYQQYLRLTRFPWSSMTKRLKWLFGIPQAKSLMTA